MDQNSYLYQSPLLRVLQERGFIHQVTHPQELDERCQKGAISAYWGCDATAPSLHVGNLMGLMVMRWLLETGHHPILLIGGGTSKIGDPSGRTTDRKLLDEEVLETNKRGILNCFEKVIPLDRALCVDNADWLDRLAYIPFLRDVGVHFSVNRMLTFDSIKSRLDRQDPLSFIEFNYILLQSYDFLALHRAHGCQLQLGGSEQWGNIVSGVDLVRRMDQATVYGLTWPLLETSSGAKMGKTAQGAVWLQAHMTSVHDYWQFWRNVDDRDVVRFLKIYTMVPLKDLEDFTHLSGHECNAAKIFLADQATAFLHGNQALKDLHQKLEDFSADNQEAPHDGLPVFILEEKDFEQGVELSSILATMGFLPSKTQARQKIEEGGVYLEEERVTDAFLCLTKKNFSEEKSRLRVRFGQKKRGWIVVEKK